MSKFYDSGIRAIMRGQCNVEDGNLRAILVFDGYKPDYEKHSTPADVTGQAKELKLEGVRVTGSGIVKLQGELRFRSVKESNARLGGVLFAHGEHLIVYHDRETLPSLTLKPNGGDVVVQFENDEAFQL